MKAPHASGMGQLGHDQSVPPNPQPVHTQTIQGNIPVPVEISQWQWFKLLHSEKEGWLYTTMIGTGPKRDIWLPYPFNIDEKHSNPIHFRPDMDAYCGVALREQKGEISSEKLTDLLWLDLDAKERHGVSYGFRLDHL